MAVTNRSFHYLKNKWSTKQQRTQKDLVTRHKQAFEWLKQSSKNVAMGSLGGLILLTSPVSTSSAIPTNATPQPQVEKVPTLDDDLKQYIPREVRPLIPQEETRIGQMLSRHFGITVAPELEGKRLNRTYGLIGAEQHLMRYPGDTMETHFQDTNDSQKYYSSGMAPGRGAWGYFASSAESMTEEDALREKYYIAVPTFLSEDYNSRTAEYSKFFKYHKMLVVNPENGKAIVAVIGDAGPAPFTGKHLGGSPEVMSYLERVDGAARGPVLYYFIDDPDNKVPLGPIQPTDNSINAARKGINDNSI